MGYPGTYSPTLINKYMSINAKRIKELSNNPAGNNQDWAQGFIDEALQNNVLLLITESYRTTARQTELYKIYLAGGSLAAPPGLSWHEYGMAFDVVPITPQGNADYNASFPGGWNSITQWAYNWGFNTGQSFGDAPHIYQDMGLSIEDFIARNYPNGAKYKPPGSNIAGFTSWFMIAATIGLFISEDFRKKTKKQ